MINNKVLMDKEAEHYENDPEFQEFLNREFDKTAVHAPIDELADFAFGSLQEAIKAFEEYKSN